jgi:hypothetical protein
MIPAFDCFVGIDWSGDNKPWQKGLKIATAYPGSAAPRLEESPIHKGRWSRTEAMRWIEDRFRGQRALIGLDFAFGFPPVALSGNIGLDWDYVESLCGSHPNFYGGAFFRPPVCKHSHLINSPWLPKQSYSANDLRMTDMVAMETVGARPQSIFNAVGPAQVGPSSISGMRALRSLRQRCGHRISIWPFDEPCRTGSVIVEIFPRYYPLLKQKSARLVEHENLNSALAAFDSDRSELAPGSEDEGDAILSAAALRYLSRQESLFQLPDPSTRPQGWIFGVPVRNAKSASRRGISRRNLSHLDRGGG